MKILDKRSYLVHAEASQDTPVRLYLLNTAGETVRSVPVESSGTTVAVPVGLTVEYFSIDGQKPSTAQVNGADANTVALTGIGHAGYILTTHPRVGDIVVFIQ